LIYFTEDALRIIKQKFFYLELADGGKSIIYKQDKSKAEEALKKEKYALRFSLYSMLDENRTENDVYLLGVQNKQMLMDKILKVLYQEPLNVIYINIGSGWSTLFLSDTDAQNDCYKNLNPELYSWPCVIADDDLSKTLRLQLKPEHELSKILDELTKLKK